MARLRAAPSAQSVSGSTQTRQALKEKTNTTRSKAANDGGDGITDKVVKDARPKRGRANKASQNAEELVMAGGLGVVDAEPERATLLTNEHPATTDELVKSDAPTIAAAKPTRRAPRMTRKAVQTEAKSAVLQDVRNRMVGTAPVETEANKAPPSSATEDSTKLPRASRNKPHTARKSAASNPERSEFSLSPSPPPQSENPSNKKIQRSSLPHPNSALKVQQGTPGLETSILALKNFKRRPRQPSMLQMVQQLTASARPSAIHVPADENASVFDVEDDEEEEFAPDAAGTPLYANKAKMTTLGGAKDISDSQQQAPAVSASAAKTRKRKSEEANLTTSGSDAPRTKRQRSVAGLGDQPDAPQTISSTRRSSSERQAKSREQTLSDAESIVSISSTPPPQRKRPSNADRADNDPEPRITSTLNRNQRHIRNASQPAREEDPVDGTMAEPVSSSPLPSPPNLANRKDAIAESPVEESPQGRRGRTKKSTKAKPITTATLQALLPKRRQPLRPRQRKSEYDFESDSGEEKHRAQTEGVEEDDDDDVVAAKSRRRTKMLPQKGQKPTQIKPKTRQSKVAATTRKSTTARAPQPKSTNRKQSRKTSARPTATATSDKENEDAAPFSPPAEDNENEDEDSLLPDTSLSMHEAAQSAELEAARRKFAEVDGWDLEFESMSVVDEEGRSSSQNWR